MLVGIAPPRNDFRNDSKSPNKLDTRCITLNHISRFISKIYEKTVFIEYLPHFDNQSNIKLDCQICYILENLLQKMAKEI